MNRDYTTYRADELLNDDYFLKSELHPTEQDRQFWSQLQTENESLAQEIKKARFFLKSIRTTSEMQFLSTGEQQVLWESIQKANTRSDIRKKRSFFIKITISVAASLLLLFSFGWYFLYKQEESVDY